MYTYANYTYANFRYRVMLQCWETDPDHRPTFTALVDVLSQSLEVMANYMDLQNNTGKPYSTDEVTSIVNAEEQEPSHSVIIMENTAVTELYDSEGTNSDESQPM